MPGYKWNGFIARLTNKCRYTENAVKIEKVRKNTYGETGICIFCKIVQVEEMIYQDELISIFKDIKEDAKFHMLAIPNEHIRNIDFLGLEHIEMIQRMVEIGLIKLKEMFPEEKYVFGFHHPPRNSIDHLHMHCIVKPFKKFKSKMSYSNYLWFISPEEVVKKILNEKQPQIKLL